MAEPQGAERRLKPRYALQLTGSAQVLYRRAPAAPDAAPDGRFKVETINISAGGFMLTFDAPVSDGDVLRLVFPVPGGERELRAEGQIQWLRKNATDLLGRYCAGVAFKNTPETDVDALVSYAAEQNPDPVP